MLETSIAGSASGIAVPRLHAETSIASSASGIAVSNAVSFFL